MFLMILILLPLAYGKPSFSSSSVFILPNADFMVYVIPGEGEKISSCVLNYIYNNSTITQGIDMTNVKNYDSPGFKGRLFSLGRNACGIKILRANTSDPSRYDIEANYTTITNANEHWSSFFNLLFYERLKLENLTKAAELGNSTEIICGLKNRGCILKNPQGEIVFRSPGKQCVYKIKHVTMKDIGNWTCFPQAPFKMEGIFNRLELKLFHRLPPETWYNEEGGYGYIGCNYSDNSIYRNNKCQLFRPDKKVFTFGITGNTDRYTSVGTEFEPGFTKCQITFKLPILPEEKGIWKCKIVGQTGGFINTDPGSEVPHRKHYELMVEPDEPADIACHVPFSSDNCVIEAPNGEKYTGGTYLNYWLGTCEVHIKKINASHIGGWRCIFARRDSVVDEIITIQVKSFDTIKPSFTEIEADETENIVLMCKVEYPIKKCRFIDPVGRTYHVSPDKPSTDNINYAGRGLNFGDCGLNIKHLSKDHEGIWTCIAQNRDPRNDTDMGEISAKVKVIMDSSAIVNNAASIGIGVGVGVAALLFTTILVYRKVHKRRDYNNADTSGSPPRNSTSTNESETIFSINTMRTEEEVTN